MLKGRRFYHSDSFRDGVKELRPIFTIPFLAYDRACSPEALFDVLQ